MAEIGGLPQQLEDSDQTYSEIATINRRMNLLENRFRNIGDQVNRSEILTFLDNYRQMKLEFDLPEKILENKPTVSDLAGLSP